MKTSKHLITGIASMFFFAGLAATNSSEAADGAKKHFKPLTQQGLTVPRQEPRKRLKVPVPTPSCPQGWAVKKVYGGKRAGGTSDYRGYICKPVIPRNVKCPPNQPFFSDGCSFGCLTPEG